MRKSEIFESYAKIAQEEGLVSEAEHAEHTEKNLDSPRWDSLSIEQIGKLYDTKPAAPKDMEYKNNIMEKAHPDPVVLFMSHDKLNSLVENEIEGQNARIHISLKEPDGHLTQRKYAEKKLVLSLVRLANDLDNRDQEELRVLADTCLLQATHQQMTKVAAIPFLIYPIAALIGAIYAKNHMAFHSDGFSADYDKTVAEIDDLLNANSSLQTTVGAGYTYTPQFLQTCNQLKTDLAKLNTEVQKALPILSNLQTPRNADELKALAQQPETHEAVQSLNDLHTVMNEISPFIMTVGSDFSKSSYKQQAIKHKGFLSSLVDSAGILHGGAGLVADDFDDVRDALKTLIADVTGIMTELRNAETLRKTAIQELSAAQGAVSKMTGGTPATTTDPVAQKQPEESVENLENEIGRIPGFHT